MLHQKVGVIMGFRFPVCCGKTIEGGEFHMTGCMPLKNRANYDNIYTEKMALE